MINIDDLSEKEIEELKIKLENRTKEKNYKENIEAIKNHHKYVGKCYKEKKSDKYIRVLSSKSSNKYRLECICFEFPVKYEEHSLATRIFSSDNAFSEIIFEGFYIEDYPFFCNSINIRGKKVIDELLEISEEEYFSKMNEFFYELQEKLKNNEFDTSKNL